MNIGKVVKNNWKLIALAGAIGTMTSCGSSFDHTSNYKHISISINGKQSAFNPHHLKINKLTYHNQQLNEPNEKALIEKIITYSKPVIMDWTENRLISFEKSEVKKVYLLVDGDTLKQEQINKTNFELGNEIFLRVALGLDPSNIYTEQKVFLEEYMQGEKQK